MSGKWSMSSKGEIKFHKSYSNKWKHIPFTYYHHYLETASVSEQKCSYLFSSWEQDTQRAALVLYGELVKSLASTSMLEIGIC